MDLRLTSLAASNDTQALGYILNNSDQITGISNTRHTQIFTSLSGAGFGYGAFNLMLASAASGGPTTTYTLNALGCRSSKEGPNGTSRFLYSSDGLPLSENDIGAWVN